MGVGRFAESSRRRRHHRRRRRVKSNPPSSHTDKRARDPSLRRCRPVDVYGDTAVLFIHVVRALKSRIVTRVVCFGVVKDRRAAARSPFCASDAPPMRVVPEAELGNTVPIWLSEYSCIRIKYFSNAFLQYYSNERVFE